MNNQMKEVKELKGFYARLKEEALCISTQQQEQSLLQQQQASSENDWFADRYRQDNEQQLKFIQQQQQQSPPRQLSRSFSLHIHQSQRREQEQQQQRATPRQLERSISHAQVTRSSHVYEQQQRQQPLHHSNSSLYRDNINAPSPSPSPWEFANAFHGVYADILEHYTTRQGDATAATAACSIEVLHSQQPYQDYFASLAQTFLDFRQSLGNAGKSMQIEIAYHYTHDRHLESIAQYGLLGKQERDQLLTLQNNLDPSSRQHGTYFGQGIYTSHNPLAFVNYGHVGLVVAILRGATRRFPTNLNTAWERAQFAREAHSAGMDTVIGNKKRRRQSSYQQNNNNGDDDAQFFYDEIVLKAKTQCLPLLVYPTALIAEMDNNNNNGSNDNNGFTQVDVGCQVLADFQHRLQHFLDTFFIDQQQHQDDHYYHQAIQQQEQQFHQYNTYNLQYDTETNTRQQESLLFESSNHRDPSPAPRRQPIAALNQEPPSETNRPQSLRSSSPARQNGTGRVHRHERTTPRMITTTTSPPIVYAQHVVDEVEPSHSPAIPNDSNKRRPEQEQQHREREEHNAAPQRRGHRERQTHRHRNNKDNNNNNDNNDNEGDDDQRWTNDECQAFLQGVMIYGCQWEQIASHMMKATTIQIITPQQVSEFAHLYFPKLIANTHQRGGLASIAVGVPFMAAQQHHEEEEKEEEQSPMEQQDQSSLNYTWAANHHHQQQEDREEEEEQLLQDQYLTPLLQKRQRHVDMKHVVIKSMSSAERQQREQKKRLAGLAIPMRHQKVKSPSPMIPSFQQYDPEELKKKKKKMFTRTSKEQKTVQKEQQRREEQEQQESHVNDNNINDTTTTTKKNKKKKKFSFPALFSSSPRKQNNRRHRRRHSDTSSGAIVPMPSMHRYSSVSS